MIFGAKRHLRLLPELQASVIEWPVPFIEGIEQLLSYRGQSVDMLVSGDPFWYGAGTTLTRYLTADEWLVYPNSSTFSLAAATLGWPLEQCICLGLHAAPLNRVRRELQPNQKLILLLRDGGAVITLCERIRAWGFADSTVHILEALGGDNQRCRTLVLNGTLPTDIQHPVALAIEVAGEGPVLSVTTGLDDHFFAHDGQMTKRPVRALTLSALAPAGSEVLWDIGTGSGSIAIEWMLRHPANCALGFEHNAQRANRARENADALGTGPFEVIEGDIVVTLRTIAEKIVQKTDTYNWPDAVFIGGGLSEALLTQLWEILPDGVRVVANAVTLESEVLLAQWHAAKGGELMRIELAQAGALGKKRGWKSAYPIVQWRVVKRDD